MRASSIFWKVRSMPMFSTTSLVLRIPAVSMKRKVMPSMRVVSSITSRVVPWMSLTMAFSSWSSRLSKVLLPTLVLPTMATGTPCLMAFPVSKEWARVLMRRSISSARARRSLRSANSSSSWSLKSSSSSSNEVIFNSFSRSRVSSLLKCPFNWLIAMWWVALLVEAIRSATASACDRSILPFI